LGVIGACYQAWNNLGVRPMMAEIRPRLGTNIIFNTVVVSLLTTEFQLLQLWLYQFVSATKICY